MFKQAIKAIYIYIAAMSHIGKYNLWILLLVSGMISAVIGLLVFGGIYVMGDDLGAWLVKFYPFDLGRSYADIILNWLSRLILWLIAFFSYKYIALILLSPVMSIVSAKIEKQLTGRDTGKFTLIGELIRGVRFNIRNLGKEILYTVLILCLGFIPGVNLAIPVLLFILQSYYIGLGCMDYYMERHYTLSESIKYGQAQRFFLIGIGAAFLFTLFVPIIGFILAPMLGTIAVTEKALNVY